MREDCYNARKFQCVFSLTGSWDSVLRLRTYVVDGDEGIGESMVLVYMVSVDWRYMEYRLKW